MMRQLLGRAVCLLGLVLLDTVYGGYIVTAPNRLIPDRNESVCISLHNLESSQDIDIVIKLSTYVSYHRWGTPKAENKTLQVVKTTLQPSSGELRKCVRVLAPSSETDNVYEALLDVSGVQRLSGYKFSDSSILSLLSSWHDTTITFVQTDKPIYKPGQKVRFRVLTLDSRLRPLTDNIDEVSIQDPNGIRVEQWKDVETTKGLGDFSLGLSEEPVQGEWSIVVKQGDNEESNMFTVEEYVLPKFEVKITPPAFVTINTTDVTVQLCAKYTYGEPVRGTGYLTTCMKKGYYWNYNYGYGGRGGGGNGADNHLCHMSIIQIEDKDGCGSANITRDQAGYGDMDSFVWGSELMFEAHVIERGTNIRLNATDAQTSFYQHDIEVTMEGRDSFKPGIPYNGKVMVKHPDGTAAAQKNISVSIRNFRAGEKYEKAYLTNDEGEIFFSLPPVMEEKTSFTISATAMEYPANRWGSGRPGSSLHVTSWFSPSGRYLQFAPHEEESKCGGEAVLPLVYTTDKEEDIDLMVVVVGVGDITNHTTQMLTLMADKEVGSADDSTSSWDTSEIDDNWWGPIMPRPVLYTMVPEMSTEAMPATPGLPTTEAVPLASVAQYFGSTTIRVPITGSMSPASRVLVYYVVPDTGEVVSDEVSLTVSPCSDNMVELKFDIEKGTPDTDVTMSVKASPDSLCAYGTVDKSVYLKGGDNQLTQARISEMLQSYTLHEWSGRYRDNDYCEKQKPTPTPPVRPPGPPSFGPGGPGGPPAPPAPAGRPSPVRPQPPAPVIEDEIVPQMADNTGESDEMSGPAAIVEEAIIPQYAINTGGSDEALPPPGGDGGSSEEETSEGGDEVEWWGGRRKRSSPPGGYGGYGGYGSAYSQYKDSLQGFQSSGVVVMTDLMLETRPCIRPRYDYGYGGYGGGSYDMDGMGGPPVAMPGMAGPEAGRTGMPAGGPAGPPGDGGNFMPSVTVREFFPETWLWDLISTDDQGMAEVESKLPHTITEWVGNAMCINTKDGLGVSEPASVTTFQSFFVSATLPYSAIRGEKVPIGLTVFNYLDKCLPVQLRMKSSTDYKVHGDSTVNTCVCGKDSTTSDFLVTLNNIGTVNLTITATIVSNSEGICDSALDVDTELVGVRDAVIRPLIVEPEGAPREYSVSDFVCSDDNGVSSKMLEFPLPGDGTIVPDSVRSYLTVVGDVMGPALSNVDDLLKMPYGCGEQNMVGFSPNVFVLQYLEGSSRDTPEVREKALSHMKSGYQRELKYRHPDGSYSAFGPGGEDGSIWLTAFVVKCFAQASPFIFVDPELQSESMDFFRDNQDPDGCFPQVGLVHSKYMQGGVGKKDSSPGALTSYILIAMLEAGANKTDESVENAVKCLSKLDIKDNYTLAMMTYAFSLYDPMHPKTLELSDMLMKNAAQDSTTRHWKATPGSSKPSDDDTWWYRPVSADVETTAYALLATLELSEEDDKVENGLHIVRWLSQQRNAYGGFGSTQDTVIGLQALAQYASLVYSDGLDLTVSASYPNSASSFATFEVSDENSLVVQEEKLPDASPVNIDVSGQGCFVLQGNVRYNVYTDMVKKDSFLTSVSDFRSDEVNNPCKQRKLHVCTRFNKVGKTNMAVVHVRMISGWAAEQASLKSLLRNSGTRLKLRRYDVEKNNDVQLYFDEVPSRRNLCFSFEIQRVMHVQDTKPAVVTVYDYYEKELSSDAEYDILSSFCPYEKKLKGTKEDLPDVSWDTFLNSNTQQRQPAGNGPPRASAAGFLMEAESSDEDTMCPKCHHTVHDFDTEEEICQFKKAYKVYWRANTNFPLSLMADLRPSYGKEKFSKVLIKYSMAEGCSCITTFNARKGEKLMILGNWEEALESGDTIELDADSVILPLTRALERDITRLTKDC